MKLYRAWNSILQPSVYAENLNSTPLMVLASEVNEWRPWVNRRAWWGLGSTEQNIHVPSERGCPPLRHQPIVAMKICCLSVAVSFGCYVL